MSFGFLTSGERATISGLLTQTFETFQRDIVVWKEPIKTLIPATMPTADFGFGISPVEDQYSFTPISGVFPAVIRYANPHRAGRGIVIESSNFIIPVDEVRVKVGLECHNFIESGKTEKLSFDDRDFFFISAPQENNFMGTRYFVYLVKPKV